MASVLVIAVACLGAYPSRPVVLATSGLFVLMGIWHLADFRKRGSWSRAQQVTWGLWTLALIALTATMLVPAF